MKYAGYNESAAKIAHMNLDELLALIDNLYGRDSLKYGATLEDVREEAYRQHAQDWEAPEGFNTRTETWEPGYSPRL